MKMIDLRHISLSLALIATTAFADRTRVLVVVAATEEAGRSRALALTGTLSNRLRNADERLELITLDALAEPILAKERLRQTERGVELLRRAEQARKASGLEEAVPLYTQSLDALERGDWREATEARFTALAWNAVGTKSDDELRLLLTGRPGFQFPPINPVVDTFILEQRQARASAATVEFEVQSETSALVWFDGALLGVTPLKHRAMAGRHRLTAMAPGRPLAQHEELLAAGSVVHLSFADATNGPALRAALAEVSAGFRTGEYLTPLKRLLDTTKVPEVVVVAVTEGRAKVVRMNSSGIASTSALALPEGTETEAMASSIRRLYDQPLGVTLTEQGEVSLGPSRRTWSYLSAGGGAAVAVVGAVLLAVAGGQLQAAQQIPQTDQVTFERAVAGARGTQATGIGGLVLGAAGIGVGGWLFFTSEAAPSAPSNQEPEL